MRNLCPPLLLRRYRVFYSVVLLRMYGETKPACVHGLYARKMLILGFSLVNARSRPLHGRSWLVPRDLRRADLWIELYQQQQDRALSLRCAVFDRGPAAYHGGVPEPDYFGLAHLPDPPVAECVPPLQQLGDEHAHRVLRLPAAHPRALRPLLLRQVRLPRAPGVSGEEPGREVELHRGSSRWSAVSPSHIVPLQHGAHRVQPPHPHIPRHHLQHHPPLPPDFRLMPSGMRSGDP